MTHYKHIISLHVSDKVSGTYRGALQAAARINSKKITVFNTESGSIGEQIMAIKSAKMIDQGNNVHEIVNYLTSLHGKFKMIIMLETVKYAVSGGRLKPYLGGLLKLLGLIPLVTITPDGRTDKEGIVPRGKRGWKSSIKKFKNFFGDKIPDEIGIIHANCLDKAKKFEELLRTHFPKAKYYYGEFGPVIGTYAGPGAIVFVGFSGAQIPLAPLKSGESTIDKIINRLTLPSGLGNLPILKK